MKPASALQQPIKALRRSYSESKFLAPGLLSRLLLKSHPIPYVAISVAVLAAACERQAPFPMKPHPSVPAPPRGSGHTGTRTGCEGRKNNAASRPGVINRVGPR